eukprot:bmy_10531T0
MAAPTETQRMGAAILPPEQSRPGCGVGKAARYRTAQAREPSALLTQTGSGRVRRYGCDSCPGLSRDGRF